MKYNLKMATFYNMIQTLQNVETFSGAWRFQNLENFLKITLLLKHLEKVFKLHSASFKIS